MKQLIIKSPKLHLTLSTHYQAANYQIPKTTPPSIHSLSRSQLLKPQNYTSLYPTSIKQLIIKFPKLHTSLYPHSIKQPVIKAPKLHLTLSNIYQVAIYQSHKPTPIHPLSSS